MFAKTPGHTPYTYIARILVSFDILFIYLRGIRSISTLGYTEEKNTQFFPNQMFAYLKIIIMYVVFFTQK